MHSFRWCAQLGEPEPLYQRLFWPWLSTRTAMVFGEEADVMCSVMSYWNVLQADAARSVSGGFASGTYTHRGDSQRAGHSPEFVHMRI